MTRAREIASQGGLVLISSTTIGSAVSSVVVSNCFNATYDNYLLQVSSAASSSVYLNLQLGSTTTGYFGTLSYISSGTTGQTVSGTSNVSSFTDIGGGSASGVSATIELSNPFKPLQTFLRATYWDSGGYGWKIGRLNNTTSYTDLTLMSGPGTLTGGTIEVYGYK
jgi:hypothetical protein